VMGDPGRLRQILTNLLTNSIKFTSQGSVTLRVHVKNQTTDTIDINFVIEDTGIGIEEEIRKKLFKPFSQADSSTARRYGGTGLGLTICKNLVELMHGGIKLESALGVGTRASFWIPLKKAESFPDASPMVELDDIPHRFQSELSMSLDDYDINRASPPMPSPNNAPPLVGNRVESAVSTPGTPGLLSAEKMALPEIERKAIQVLVVEDKYVKHVSLVSSH